MLISDTLNVNVLFPVVPALGGGRWEGLISHGLNHYSRRRDSSHWPLYKIFQFLKVSSQRLFLGVGLRSGWGATRPQPRGGPECVADLFIFMKNVEETKPKGGGGGGGSAAHVHTLACTHPGTCSVDPLDQRADRPCLHARDAAAAGGAGSPLRVSLSHAGWLHNSLHWGPGNLARAKNTPRAPNTTE